MENIGTNETVADAEIRKAQKEALRQQHRAELADQLTKMADFVHYRGQYLNNVPDLWENKAKADELLNQIVDLIERNL